MVTRVYTAPRANEGDYTELHNTGRQPQPALAKELTAADIGGLPASIAALQAEIDAAELQISALQTQVNALDSSDIANASGVTGANVTAALDDLQAQIVAEASQPGYIARFGYVNAASAKLGTTFAGVTLIAAVTWNTPTDVPPGNTFTWDLWGASGGAVGGKASLTGSALNAHGAPSAGSAHRRFTCSRADILAALPLVLTAPLGGSGSVGAQRVPADGSGTTIPLAPSNGAAATVGSLASAFPGGAGFRDPSTAPSTRAGSSGGGTLSAGGQGTSTAIVAGGNPGAPPAGGTGEGGAGCTGLSGGGNGASGAEHGGASCTASGTAATTFQPGGTSAYGGSAGGWGAAFNTGSTAATNAGAGGGPAGGGAAGISAVATAPANVTGGNGGMGPDGTLFRGAAGGGGGGSAKLGSVDALNGGNCIGGNGGDGSFPGGGAGGGGDAAWGGSAAPAGTVVRGGNGGKGGDALILLTIT